MFCSYYFPFLVSSSCNTSLCSLNVEYSSFMFNANLPFRISFCLKLYCFFFSSDWEPTYTALSVIAVLMQKDYLIWHFIKSNWTFSTVAVLHLKQFPLSSILYYFFFLYHLLLNSPTFASIRSLFSSHWTISLFKEIFWISIYLFIFCLMYSQRLTFGFAVCVLI